mmetsp:Transcript_22835/g.74229  ORF Transcript_22835/g.74229 Transcript_22835/m.74229 type:complete len:156 (-) Transcript_22835:230-697(-)
MNRAAPPLVGPRNPFCPPPLDAALGSQVSPEFQWQAARMPPLSRSLLLFGDDPGSVDPAELVNELRLDLSTAEDVRRALGARGDEAVLRSPAVLPPAACEALRNAVSARRTRSMALPTTSSTSAARSSSRRSARRRRRRCGVCQPPSSARRRTRR